MDAKTLLDYTASLDCIHCGLCLSSCPTYRLTGREPSSPRGRIALMRAVAEERLAPDATYAEELDFCLVCRNCESVCPAGVRFGELMESARDGIARRSHGPLARFARWIGFRVVLPHRTALRIASGGLRFLQRTRLLRWIAWTGERGRAALDLPAVPPRRERRLLPALTPAPPAAKASSPRWPEQVLLPERVLLYEGCVMPELFGRVNRATLACLNHVGCEVHCPPGRSACCGALHAHNGDLAGARRLARATIASWSPPALAGAPIVVNSAGCGAHLAHYGRLLSEDPLWRDRAREFAERVVDFSAFLAPRLLAPPHATLSAAALRAPALAATLAGPIAWDDPCHLCHGQGIRAEPRRLLDAIVGLERVELADSESCCGSAGIYSLLRPADAQAVFAAKLADFERSGAAALVTANPGCQLQWQSGLARAGRGDVPVWHLAEVLAAALRSGAHAGQ